MAAAAVGEALDPAFFEACAHPVRVDLIRRLVHGGAADISEIAASFSQDRSVISRHLSTLQRVGLLSVSREGRRVVYDIDGPAVLRRLERLTEAVRALSAICCPPAGQGATSDDGDPGG